MPLPAGPAKLDATGTAVRITVGQRVQCMSRLSKETGLGSVSKPELSTEAERRSRERREREAAKRAELRQQIQEIM